MLGTRLFVEYLRVLREISGHDRCVAALALAVRVLTDVSDSWRWGERGGGWNQEGGESRICASSRPLAPLHAFNHRKASLSLVGPLETQVPQPHLTRTARQTGVPSGPCFLFPSFRRHSEVEQATRPCLALRPDHTFIQGAFFKRPCCPSPVVFFFFLKKGKQEGGNVNTLISCLCQSIGDSVQRQRWWMKSVEFGGLMLKINRIAPCTRPKTSSVSIIDKVHQSCFTGTKESWIQAVCCLRAKKKKKKKLSRCGWEMTFAAVSELTLVEMFGTGAASGLPVVSSLTEHPDVPADSWFPAHTRRREARRWNTSIRSAYFASKWQIKRKGTNISTLCCVFNNTEKLPSRIWAKLQKLYLDWQIGKSWILQYSSIAILFQIRDYHQFFLFCPQGCIK